MPTITVVTVALNDLEGIKRTFASLDRQSYRDVQHVVIDGGSTDGTATWAKEHPSFTDTTVTSEPDDGIYNAMNKGITAATGDLIAFLNAGDEYTDESVLKIVASDFAAHPWQWAHGFGRIVAADGRRTARGRVRSKYSWKRNTFWDYEMCHPAVFMQLSLVRELGGFDERLHIAADYRLTTAAGMVATPRVFPLLMADQVEGGISDVKPAQSLLETHRVRIELLGMGVVPRTVDYAWTFLLLAKSRSRRRAGQSIRALRHLIFESGTHYG